MRLPQPGQALVLSQTCPWLVGGGARLFPRQLSQNPLLRENMMNDRTDKKVLITGATQGIGRATIEGDE